MDPIARVAEMRRHPSACVYCTAAPDTDEHVLPEAVGGRLSASILCSVHNNAVSVAADEPFARHFETLTFAVGVRRQRGNAHGKVGTTVTFIGQDGRRTTVLPDGRSEFAFEAERDDEGVVQRASGPLPQLKRLAKTHPDPKGFQLFEVAGRGVTIPVRVGIGRESLPGFLKAALHFAAGFVAAPTPTTVDALVPAIFRHRPVPVLTILPFRAPYFDPAGPIRHEVTIYPDGRDAVVTIMLFSSVCVTLALPGFYTSHALRYVQLLDGTGPQLVDVEAIPMPRDGPSDRELDAVFATASANIERIFRSRAARDIEDIAQESARVAFGHAARVGDLSQFPVYFRAELQRVPLEMDVVAELVRQAVAYIAQGRDPLNLRPMLIR